MPVWRRVKGSPGALVIAAVLLVGPVAWHPATLADPLARAGYDAEGRMEALGVPGAAVAVFERDGLLWSEGYGVRTAGGADSVTSRTLFQAASISKPVTAAAVLRLADAGLVDPDEDVNHSLVRWKVPEGELTQDEPVTLRRILTHRAGLTVHGFPGYHREVRLPSLPEILDGRGQANTGPVRVEEVPGRVERYSGGGTTVAELLLEDVVERPFPEIMKEWVLGPAGMAESTFEQPLPSESESRAAQGHGPGGRVVDGGWHVYPERAAAGLWTTAEDLARFARAVLVSLAGENPGLLSRAGARSMVLPEGGTFGMGFMAEELSGSRVVFHGGANRGFSGLLVVFPDEGGGVVVLTNGDNGHVLAREVVDVVAGVHGWGVAR